MWYAASSPPNGWLECNGQSTVSYPALAAIVGATVPDLRGEFIRGFDHGRGVDIGRSFGSWQIDMFKSHNHENGKNSVWWDQIGAGTISTSGIRGFIDNTSVINTGGIETRPRNIALLPCIKY